MEGSSTDNWRQSSGTATIGKQLLDQRGNHLAALHRRVRVRTGAIRYNPAPVALMRMPKHDCDSRRALDHSPARPAAGSSGACSGRVTLQMTKYFGLGWMVAHGALL
jgi:hypothetical protein